MLYLLMGYLFLFIYRPFEIWPALGEMRLELLYMLITLGVWACRGEKRWLANPIHWAIFAFAGAVLVCWAASPWAAEGSDTVDKYFKCLVFYVLVVTVVQDEQGLKRLVQVLIVSMAVYLLHSLWEFRNGRHEYRMGIVRLIGVDGTLNNPNALAGSIVYTLPLVSAAWVSDSTKWWRRFLVGYVVIAVGCVALTGSRGGFLGLILCTLLTLGRGRRKWVWGGGALLAAPLLWVLLPTPLQNRFETIVHPEAGPRNAQLSAEGRIEGLLVGLDLWQEYPLTGCGPGAWRPASGKDLESHNLYGELLGEMGLVGAVAFAALLLVFWRNQRRIAQAYREHPEWGEDFLFHLGRSTGVAIILMLFAGNFGHNLFRANWLWYGAFFVIAAHAVQQRLGETLASDPGPVEIGASAGASWEQPQPECVGGEW